MISGQGITGEIVVGDTDTFWFEAQQNDHVTITVEEIGNKGNPRLQIFATDGQVLVNESGNDGAVASISAEQSGTYYVVIRDGSDDQPLDYRITLTSDGVTAGSARP